MRTEPGNGDAPLTVEFSLYGHRVIFHLPDTTDLIQKKISESKMFYELDLLENMRARLHAGGLCVDVGAHLGNHTIFLAKICGMRVLAFEPQPDIYRLLVKHVELNGVADRVQTFNMALGEVDARGSMTSPLADNTGGATLELNDSGSVKVSTLDQHIGDQKVELVKIDVEGFELEVLKGARQTITRNKPLLFAEATSTQARTALDVYLSPMGYISGEAFCSTPVITFEHCTNETQRMAALTGRIVSAHDDLEENLRRHLREHSREQRHHLREETRRLRRRIGSLSSSTSKIGQWTDSMEPRLDAVRREVAALRDPIAELTRSTGRHTALLYELWNLGIQTYDHVLGAGGEKNASANQYKPLNSAAADLSDWEPKRKRWNVLRGTDSNSFLQGYTSKVSACPGEMVYFHLSTNRTPMFVKIRVFGYRRRGQPRLSELDTSPALAIPNNGVWTSNSSAHVDERSWPEVYGLRLGRNWRTGFYLARFETLEGKAFLHPFWVTNRTAESSTLRLCPTITHYLSNRWQNTPSSSWSWLNRARIPVLPLLHTQTVRFPRPFYGARGGDALRHELPLFRWAKANAVTMDCHTDMEVHRTPALLDSYDHVVIAGDCHYLTRPLLDALRGFVSRGGSITILGAAPGEHEVTLDIEARLISTVRQTSEWRSANADLWRATQRWTHKGPPLNLSFTSHANSGVLRDSDFAAPVLIKGLCEGRLSGTNLPDSDPILLARATAGGKRCDTTLETTTSGGRIFVAGTDNWPTTIDDLFNSKGASSELDFVTARLLGASTDRSYREMLVSVIMTSYNSADFISGAVESILGQSYDHLELVVVDDNSSDSTFEVLLDCAAKDPRVRPFKSYRNHGTYWSKNLGITLARGELITFQDSDDTSSPDRLMQQVQALRLNPAAIGSMVDYERHNEHGELQLNRGLTQRRCFLSLMIRASDVIERAGYFDSVRTSADQEYLHRLRLIFGPERIIEIRKPLYRALVRQGSLTTSAGAEVILDTGTTSHLSESRLQYVESFKQWHQRIKRDGISPYLAFPLTERLFVARNEICIDAGRTQDTLPKAEAESAIESFRERTLRNSNGEELSFMIEPLPDAPDDWQRLVGLEQPKLTSPREARDFDVIIMSDFRFPGGTSQSNAAEIVVQARTGLSTGLAQVNSPVLKRDHPINPVIQRLVDDGSARLLSANQSTSCKLLVIRHPTVLERPIEELPQIQTDEVVVIVNQAPVDENTGRVFYEMEKCQSTARKRFGTPGTWYPIGPLVRNAVADLPGHELLSPDNWENIIDIDEWSEPRPGFVGDLPVIGRHSRDSADKWPPDRNTILAAYPPEVKVRVLGGAASVKETLGAYPENWEVLEFGTERPQDFLRTIDFMVYFHHPSLVEAFGRSILEALAAGVPAIIPHHFSVLFEDVAIYAEPHEVLGIVQRLYADRARYEQLSRAGIDFVKRRFSYNVHSDRLKRLIPVSVEAASEVEQTSKEAAGSALLDPDSIYKFGFELSGVEPSSRGRLRAVSRSSGQDVFVIPVDGTRSAMSEFVVNAEGSTQIDVFVENTEGPAFSIAKMRSRRRADRPQQPTLALTDSSVTAALATYPGRREVAPAVIDSLAPQVDKLFIYLNNYDDIPPFIRDSPHRDRIVFILDPSSQLRAAAKFNWLESICGYHLLCDDDIIYPPDYAKRMVDAINRHNRNKIIGVHGVIYERELVDAKSSRLAVFKFPIELDEDTPVHFLGTGTVALHSSILLRLDTTEFKDYPIANDEILAVSAKEAGVPMVCINRKAQWLVPHADVEFGIFEERQIDGGEQDKATELLARANPWPDLDAKFR
jgi:FkbM family methyltransferase